MIIVEKRYGDVTLRAEGGSAAEVIAGLDDEAQRAGLLSNAAGSEAPKGKRGRPSKAEKEAAAVVEAARLQSPQSQPFAGPAQNVPPGDPNPGNAVDPAWLTHQAQQAAASQLPSFPGAPPQLPVAPPPGQPVAPPAPMPAFPGAPEPQPAAFDPPNRADAQTSGWANYAEQQIENYRKVNPGMADSVLIVTLAQFLGQAAPDFQTARAWMHKMDSATLQNVVRAIGERITR